MRFDSSSELTWLEISFTKSGGMSGDGDSILWPARATWIEAIQYSLLGQKLSIAEVLFLVNSNSSKGKSVSRMTGVSAASVQNDSATNHESEGKLGCLKCHLTFQIAGWRVRPLSRGFDCTKLCITISHSAEIDILFVVLETDNRSEGAVMVVPTSQVQILCICDLMMDDVVVD